MSRLGRQTITIPDGVSVTMTDNVLSVSGAKGTLTRTIRDMIEINVASDQVTTALKRDTKFARSLWGTYAAHISNMITGVSQGFEKKLEINGIGYRVELEGNTLVVNVGFSHPVRFTLPDGISVSVEKNIVTINGFDKEVVGQFAANVRQIRPPEPYKGKGIHYQGEYIIRKQGKKAV